MRIASLFLLCLALAVIPASAQVIYSNGLCSVGSGGCTTDAWTINFGYVVSDSFTTSGPMTGFDFVVWAFPGDTLSTVDWSVTSAEFGGTTYGSGTGAATLTADQGTNQFGYDVQTYNVAASVALSGGSYWLNLQNAVVASGDPIYWDENGGKSSASESAVGTIPSESFDITGGTTSTTTGSTPEPSSIMLFGSGVLGLAGVLRRKLF
jgi:hypothetical protein